MLRREHPSAETSLTIPSNFTAKPEPIIGLARQINRLEDFKDFSD